MRPTIQVTSEIGRLKKVIVHQPGLELLAITPSNQGEYLYNDLIDLPQARLEHQRFVALLKRFAEVVDVVSLLRETLHIPEARHFLITRSEEVTADHNLRADLADISVDTLIERFITGWQPRAGLFSEALDRLSYALPPVPNLFFTRDAAMVIGNDVVIGATRFVSRWPEEALMRTLFGFHPDLAGHTIRYDGSDERRHGYSLEGGDVHILRDDLLLVGISDRTSSAALDIFTDTLFAQGKIRDVLAVVLPSPSPAIHLDMVWTQVDKAQCLVFAPMFIGPLRCPVLHRSAHKQTTATPPDLFTALKNLQLPMEPIVCGGQESRMQEREQWSSGCNFLALAPGQVIGYNRNTRTLAAMQQAGFRIIAGDSLLSNETSITAHEKVVITFQGSELVRGGGGARCMSCPIWREAY